MLWRRTLGDESEATKFRCPRRWMSSPRWEPSIKVWPCLFPVIDRQTFFYQMYGFQYSFKEEWISKLNLRLKSINDNRYQRGTWGIPSNVVGVVIRYWFMWWISLSMDGFHVTYLFWSLCTVAWCFGGKKWEMSLEKPRE